VLFCIIDIFDCGVHIYSIRPWRSKYNILSLTKTSYTPAISKLHFFSTTNNSSAHIFSLYITRQGLLFSHYVYLPFHSYSQPQSMCSTCFKNPKLTKVITNNKQINGSHFNSCHFPITLGI
jgi:hypothetical protein